MIDTVCMRSPYLPDDDALTIEMHLTRHTGVNNATGEILYERTKGQVSGSHGALLNLRLERTRLLVPPEAPPHTRPIEVECAPYLIAEGSVHKLMLGHNICGGPCAFVLSMEWYVHELERILGVNLPPAGIWQVDRIDWAECYRLSPAGVREYIDGLNAATYPRRKVVHHAGESVYATGDTTTVKIYDKAIEFSQNDAKRLRKHKHWMEAHTLQELADGVLRLEVTIRASKLRADLGAKPLVSDITDEYLRGVFDREIMKLLKEGRSDRNTVRAHAGVLQRLNEVHPAKLARTLFATWTQLTLLHEGKVRASLGDSTFYRHRSALMAAGCAWSGSGMVEYKSALPDGFSPIRSDRHYLADVDPAVVECLRPFVSLAETFPVETENAGSAGLTNGRLSFDVTGSKSVEYALRESRCASRAREIGGRSP